MSLVVDKMFVVYNPEHIPEAVVQVSRGMVILCLDFFIGRELKKRNIPFVSLIDTVNKDTEVGDWWVLTHEISREWYRLPSMKFFEYEGIRIAEAPEPVMQEYLSRLFYYVHAYTILKRIYPGVRFLIPTPVVDDSPTRSCLAFFMSWVIADAARVIGLPHDLIGFRPVPNVYLFPRVTWKTFVIKLYNLCVSLIPRRRLKIYSTEYWTFVSPVVSCLENTELILFESRKFYRIPWRQILRSRIRIFRPSDSISDSERRVVTDIAKRFVGNWKDARQEVFSYLNSLNRDLNWTPVLEVCEYLVAYSSRVVADIRSLQYIIKKEKPDLVLQMASVGGPQHYFLLMARVAAQFKIPSIELQHAGATVDPRSVYCRIETDYLATYGKNVNRWHNLIGHDPKKLIPVGAPRFDQYVNNKNYGVKRGKQLFAQLGLNLNRPVLFVAVPFSETFASALDSYQLAEFCKAIRAIWDKVPGLQLLFKFRTSRHIGGMREYLQELFPSDCVMVGDEDIFPLLCASDAAICNNSTTIYQVLLAQKPLVLCPWKCFDSYHARVYEQAAPLFYSAMEAVDVVERIFTDTDYRRELLIRQGHFLGGYSFDGKSSQRVAELIKKIAQK